MSFYLHVTAQKEATGGGEQSGEWRPCVAWGSWNEELGVSRL